MERYVLKRFCDFHHDTTEASFSCCFKCKADLCYMHSITLETAYQPYKQYIFCPKCFEKIFNEEVS